MPVSDIARKLLDWYAANARQLPWRKTADPYAILVSEYMLQQTRVDTVIPYYHAWLERFPDLFALAKASQQEVLRVWEGLGYYSRARALHAAAHKIVHEFEGKIPTEKTDLLLLPGVGAYSAAALAALLGKKDEPAIDANLARVAARLFDIVEPVSNPAVRNFIETQLRAILPEGKAGDFNQALMDLGSLICLPKHPRCKECPLKTFCCAFQNGTQNERPMQIPKKTIPAYEVAAAVIWYESKTLIAHRPQKALLGGMWEFPGGKLEPGEEAQQALEREIREELGCVIRVGELIGTYKHAYTHFKVHVQAFWCTLAGGEPRALEASEIAWVYPQQLDRYAMGKVDRMIARRVQVLSSV